MQENFGEKMATILAPYKGERGAVIPILQKVQETFGYLSQEATSVVARFLRVSQSEIFGIASFYAQFRFSRPGDHGIKVCLGTACHVRGAELLMDSFKRELGLEGKQMVTPDYKFGMERVACVGSCALAPVVVVDDKVYGRVSTTKVKEIMKDFQ